MLRLSTKSNVKGAHPLRVDDVAIRKIAVRDRFKTDVR
jgi:hypothetical protein